MQPPSVPSAPTTPVAAVLGDEPIGRDVLFAVRMADWLDDKYIDPLVGFVLPGAGDRNANLLLERHVLGPSPWRDWGAVLGAVFVLLLALCAPIALIVLAIRQFG